MLGASLVGICELDRRWLYSEEYDLRTGQQSPVAVPEEFRFAIVMAYEMDYRMIQLSPAVTHGFTVGLGYTKWQLQGVPSPSSSGCSGIGPSRWVTIPPPAFRWRSMPDSGNWGEWG
jgi:hypothetical protein